MDHIYTMSNTIKLYMRSYLVWILTVPLLSDLKSFAYIVSAVYGFM